MRVLEYDREGCSYHAKGLWIDWPHTDLGGPLSNPSTPTADAREGGGRGRKVVEDEEEGEEKRRQEGSDEEGLVCVSMAGSSNLDQRGFERDVESEVQSSYSCTRYVYMYPIYYMIYVYVYVQL